MEKVSVQGEWEVGAGWHWHWALARAPGWQSLMAGREQRGGQESLSLEGLEFRERRRNSPLD